MGSGGGVWDVEDANSVPRLNQKTILVDTGANINSATTYAGMLAYCTSTGSGFSADVLYERNTANTSWAPVGGDQKPYLLLSTTIGDYSQPSSATATSVATPSTSDSYDFSTSTGWTTVGTGVSITAGVGRVSAVDLTTHNRMHRPLSAALSDTLWQIDFDFIGTALATNRSSVAIALTSDTGNIGSQDAILVYFNDTGGTKSLGFRSHDAGVLVESGAVITISLSTQYYCRINRISATQATLKVYSDEGRLTQVGSTTTINVTGVTALANLQFGSWAAGIGGETASYDIDNVTTGQFFSASKAVDGNTTTKFKSTSEANPAIYVDLTSAREIVGVAINLDRTDTTITSIKIRASTDTTFDDTENVAYVNVSDFTDDTWRFLATNFTSANKRYVQIIANETGVLAINEIKVRYGVSDAIKILDHRHRTRNVSAADSFVDSN